MYIKIYKNRIHGKKPTGFHMMGTKPGPLIQAEK